MLTCGAFGLLVCVAYIAVTFLLMMLAGVSFDGLTIINVGLAFVSLLTYTFMAIACGFLLGSTGFNEMATNGFANVFALLVMFTSGMAFPVDMMPDPMILIGKLLPGLVALLVDRLCVRAWHGFLAWRGLRHVGMRYRLGGVVRSGVHLPWSGIGTYPPCAPDVGLARHHPTGAITAQSQVRVYT